MPFSRNTSPGYLINHLARLFVSALQKEIKPLGLTTGVFPIMIHLWEKDGLSQKELVEQVGIEQATMANTLTRMERDGLITRRRDSSDKRMQHIWLSAHGRNLREPALAKAMKQNASVLAGLSQKEQQQIVLLVSKAIRSIEAGGGSEHIV